MSRAHLSALVAQAEADDLDLVSEMVRLACDSRAERALVRRSCSSSSCSIHSPGSTIAPSRTAAAAGGTILIRQRACSASAGSTREGRLDRRRGAGGGGEEGRPIWLGHATLARSVRPYPESADIWRMITRTAYVQLALLAAAAGGDARSAWR